jgi:hypothetical protein
MAYTTNVFSKFYKYQPPSLNCEDAIEFPTAIDTVFNVCGF